MSRFILGGLVICLIALLLGCQQQPTAPDQVANASANVSSLAKGGFDQYGYNYMARIFNGTYAQWAQKKGIDPASLGDYANDKLVMKWNAEWDRGNMENWSTPPYDAWEDNEWNGIGVKNGSGEIWHYKIVWVGALLEESPYWRAGGYPIWGQFEVIMDQGKDPNLAPGHYMLKATPNGYGSAKMLP